MKCPVCFNRSEAKKYVKEQIPVVSKKEAELNQKIMLFGGLAVGFTLGVLAGSTVAALVVPKSGEETRKEMKEKTDDAVDGVKESSAKVVDKVKNAAGKVKEKIIGFDEDDVVVEYTIRYDDEGVAEEYCCAEQDDAEAEEGCCETPAEPEAQAEPEAAESAPAEEETAE